AWDAEEGLFMPDFDVTIVYEGNIETQDGSIMSRTEWSLHLATG
ncbi:lipoprotein, partial [human gut metagenome]